MQLRTFKNFLNEKIDIELLAVDMIDYYATELPRRAEDSGDFAKSREINDPATIKKIWKRAEEIQKDGITEAVSPERIAAHSKKIEDAKKNVTLILNNFTKTVSKEKDPEKIEDAFNALETLVVGYVDIMKTAP
jgi:hypothetical protein